MKNTANKHAYLIKQGGWTLIELMIAVAIIAIIAVIIFPNYQDYIVRGGRTEVQTTMIRIAQNLENYKMANNNSYASAVLASDAIHGETDFKSSGVVIYTLGLEATANSWTLEAEPVSTSRQAGDGDVVLNDLGQRCWTKGATCTLSATTAWTN